ncbi:MAG: hypothetical protein JWN48_1775 [Myxococcaceae bacterium]|nr:hypothetical protein [Myxococcaceae bacterium]
MRALSFAISCTLVLSGCWVVEGNGTRTDELRAGAGFSAVENDSSLEVLVERGDAFSIVVSIDDNALDHVQTEIHGNTLRISTDDLLRSLVPGPHVRVTLPHLLEAKASGSGRLDVLSFEETAPIDLRVSDSGELHFDGRAPQLSAKVTGSGELTLQGSADRLDAEVDGSGDLDARQVVVSSARLEAHGSGDLSATVNGPIDVTLSGSGDIDVFGAAVVAHSNVHGSGDLHLHP